MKLFLKSLKNSGCFFPLNGWGLFSGEKLFSSFSFPDFHFSSLPAEKNFFSQKKLFFCLFQNEVFSSGRWKSKTVFSPPRRCSKRNRRASFPDKRSFGKKQFFVSPQIRQQALCYPERAASQAQGKDFFSLEEIQNEFKLSPTVFANQIRNQKFPHEVDWVSPEILSPGSSGSSSETKSEKSEVELLREEMQKQFAEFESFRAQMKKENELLASRVLKLEQEKAVAEKAEEVAQERNSPPAKPQETSSAGMKIPFDVSQNWSFQIFQSTNAFAKFCRFGIQGQITVNGPRKNKTVCFDGKIIPVADLLKEIIVSHINPQMWKDGDEDAKINFSRKSSSLTWTTKNTGKNWGRKLVFSEKCDSVTKKQFTTLRLNS